MHWIDPNSLPETVGRVDLFLLNPRGEIDGFVLVDGTEVHLPPHMSGDIARALQPGSLVKLRAVRPRGADLLAAVAFETEDGRRYVDQGPPKDHKESRKNGASARTGAVEAEGVVRRALHGPKGETRGLLLEDGRSGRFPPHEANALRPLLRPGVAIVLRGDGVETSHGTVIAIHEIGERAGRLHAVAGKPPKPKDHKPHKEPHHKH
jgi:hypothetical protein